MTTGISTDARRTLAKRKDNHDKRRTDRRDVVSEKLIRLLIPALLLWYAMIAVAYTGDTAAEIPVTVWRGLPATLAALWILKGDDE